MTGQSIGDANQALYENRFMDDTQEYYRGWMKTTQHFPNHVNGSKVRIKRQNGTQGYSMPMFSVHDSPCNTQHYWQDPNGTTHKKYFYPEWAFLKKNGGKAA